MPSGPDLALIDGRRIGVGGSAGRRAPQRRVGVGFRLRRSAWRSAGSASEAIGASARAERLRSRRRRDRYCIRAQDLLSSSGYAAELRLAHGEVTRAVGPAARALGAVSSTPRATSLALWRCGARAPVSERVASDPIRGTGRFVSFALRSAAATPTRTVSSYISASARPWLNASSAFVKLSATVTLVSVWSSAFVAPKGASRRDP